MNIANITSRFALLSGIDAEKAYKWRSVIDDAVDYVSSIITKPKLSESDTKRLEVLCAIYAFKLYRLCNDESVSSFSVGDVSITPPAAKADTAEKMWREYVEKAQDLVSEEKFLFGRVI